jgi:hypothetical protein
MIHLAVGSEFAVLSQLALRSYDANMTLGRTKSVVILCFSYSSVTQRFRDRNEAGWLPRAVKARGQP